MLTCQQTRPLKQSGRQMTSIQPEVRVQAISIVPGGVCRYKVQLTTPHTTYNDMRLFPFLARLTFPQIPLLLIIWVSFQPH
jgi:hypothetical protein